MDLILGLPGETTEDILHTLEEVKKYNPENLTIHNLAIKKMQAGWIRKIIDIILNLIMKKYLIR